MSNQITPQKVFNFGQCSFPTMEEAMTAQKEHFRHGAHSGAWSFFITGKTLKKDDVSGKGYYPDKVVDELVAVPCHLDVNEQYGLLYHYFECLSSGVSVGTLTIGDKCYPRRYSHMFFDGSWDSLIGLCEDKSYSFNKIHFVSDFGDIVTIDDMKYFNN